MKFIDQITELNESRGQSPQELEDNFLEYMRPNYRIYSKQAKLSRLSESVCSGVWAASVTLSLVAGGFLIVEGYFWGAVGSMAAVVVGGTSFGFGVEAAIKSRLKTLKVVKAFSTLHPRIARKVLKELEAEGEALKELEAEGKKSKTVSPRKELRRKKKEAKALARHEKLELKESQRKKLELQRSRELLSKSPLSH